MAKGLETWNSTTGTRRSVIYKNRGANLIALRFRYTKKLSQKTSYELKAGDEVVSRGGEVDGLNWAVPRPMQGKNRANLDSVFLRLYLLEQLQYHRKIKLSIFFY